MGEGGRKQLRKREEGEGKEGGRDARLTVSTDMLPLLLTLTLKCCCTAHFKIMSIGSQWMVPHPVFPRSLACWTRLWVQMYSAAEQHMCLVQGSLLVSCCHQVWSRAPLSQILKLELLQTATPI